MTPLSCAEKEALLGRLEAMQIDPPGAKRTFVWRLSEENGWSRSFAERVVTEYRRFLFLAATASHPVTPSDEVDQAWHLHLAYSRHYWDELCRGILRKPLHHGPTSGGNSEAARYRDQYAATLNSYRAAFGMAPPEEIWPPQRVRFGRRFQRVDRRRYWMVPKLPTRFAFAALLLTGCGLASNDVAGSKALAFVGLAIIGVALGAMIYFAHQRYRSGGGNEASGSCGGGGSRGDSDGGDGGGCGGGCGGCGG